MFARLVEIGNVGSAEAETSVSEEQHGPTTDSDLCKYCRFSRDVAIFQNLKLPFPHRF